MTNPTWAYTKQRKVEETFVMELTFEEDLTLHALRAFVEATQYIDGWAGVDIATGNRPGHETVILIRAISRDTEYEAVEGPQLPSEVIDQEVIKDGLRHWAKAEDVPHGVTVMPANDANGFTWIRCQDTPREFVQFYYGKRDVTTFESSLTEAWPQGFIEVPR